MRRAQLILPLVVTAAALLAAPAVAQYESPAAKPAAPNDGGGGLPPFLAKMKRHDVEVRVVRPGPDGASLPVEAGTNVGIRILAGGAKVKEYVAQTGEGGVARFVGVPSNPEVQASISYELWADYQGVRFPFAFGGVPGDGALLEIEVRDVGQDLAGIELEHTFIELFIDEEQMVARHQMKLHNRTDRIIDLGAQPGGGLKLPCPAGAKHPSLHNEHDPLLEVRGTDVVFKGALPPGQPATFTVVYGIPYDRETYEWVQPMPVPVTGAMVVAAKDAQEGHQRPFPLSLHSRGALGSVSESTIDGGRRFDILRLDGARLDAGQPLRFAVSGLPTKPVVGLYATVGGILAVAGFLFLGFRRTTESGGETRSRAHLVAERDRLVKALARMRRARDKGHLTDARYDREREAITARLVSLYRALDRLESK